MQDHFMTEAQIEKELERFSVPLKDSYGNTHEIEAAGISWDWYLIITHDPEFSTEMIMDDVIEWQKTEHPNQELSFLFEEYIANLVHILGDDVTKEMQENLRRSAD